MKFGKRGKEVGRPTLSNPAARYEACEHKKVSASTVNETIGLSIVGPSIRVGHIAVVNCPRTAINGGPIRSAQKSEYRQAMDDGKSRVGDLLCRNCRFYNMTPIELLQEQVVTAQLEADAGQASFARAAVIDELQKKTGIIDWGQIQPPPTG